jgi:hypothetical protein
VTRDVVCLAILLLVALTPVPHDVAQASQPGPAGRIAINREIVNRGASAEGTLPLWDPYEFGGRPHLANPETLALYPPHILLRLLPVPFFFALSFALHTWLAGAGTYLAARALGASRLVSGLAAGAVMVSRLVLPFETRARSLDVYAVAWLPLIAALSLRSAASPGWLPHPGLVVAASFGLLASALNPTYVLATVVGSYLFSMIWVVRTADRTSLLAQPVVLAALAAGLTAVQMVPTVRFSTTAQEGNAVAADDPSLNPVQTAGAPSPELIPALRALAGRGRVLSTCTRRVDGSNWVPLGVPGVGGSGGVFAADYGRFSQVVRGPTENTRPTFEGIPEASSGPARADLLKLMGVEFLIACDSPNAQRWSPVAVHNGVGIYRSAVPAPRAFWTCAPQPVGRQEMEYRLRHSSYDANVVLQPHLIFNVRWPPGIADADRARTETALGLAPHRDIADRTWEYNLLNRSPQNVEAIVRHPLVEDTQGIDRAGMVLLHKPAPLPAFDEPKSESLLGADECHAPVPAAVQTQDRLDGGMIVDVDAPHDGIVFFSETYYRDRRAWVDGRRIGRLKVNLAFTGVPVSAGRHRIELNYDTRSFWWGAGLSVLTLAIWLQADRRGRQGAGSIRRRAPSFSSVNT